MDFLQTIIWILIIASGIALYYLLKPKLEEITKPEWKTKALAKLADLESNKKLDNKYKLLELDKVMEYILQSKFHSTKSFGEIMKENEKSFDPSPRHQIWVAHKLRNKIVHDIHYQPTPNELENNIKKYTNNIKDLLK
jgi:hypothetical protein